MRTLRGRLDKVSWLATGALIFFDGEVHTVPEGADERVVRWLVLARQEGFPVTLEVDDGGVIRAATVEVCERTLRFEGPSLTMRISERGQ